MHQRTTTAHDLKAVALMLILDIMLSFRLCLRLTILADSLGPDLAPTKCLMFLLIRLCGAQVDLRLRWSHTTKSGYIHLQTCGKESKF